VQDNHCQNWGWGWCCIEFTRKGFLAEQRLNKIAIHILGTGWPMFCAQTSKYIRALFKWSMNIWYLYMVLLTSNSQIGLTSQDNFYYTNK